MTTQVLEKLIYNSQEYGMDNRPLEDFFKLGGHRPPFWVCTTMCWRGYVGTWSLVDGRLRLDSINGYIAKGPLVEIADSAIHHQIDYEDQALCSKAALEDIFPDAHGPVFARWFSGEINAPLSAEVKRGSDGEEVSVERTLKLGFLDGILTSENVVLKFPLTRGEIESGLTNPDASVRREFAESRDYRLTPAQIERGLQDEDSVVRVAFIHRTRRTLTQEQLERAMTDECAEVRRYATLFESGKPTSFQLERALKDVSPVIRCNMAYSFSDQLTPDQMERGLTDENDDVRAAFAAVCYQPTPAQASACYQPTPAQIERGLTDKFEEVRYWFVCNEAVELSPEQIQRGLKDSYELIPIKIALRYNCDLIDVPTLALRELCRSGDHHWKYADHILQTEQWSEERRWDAEAHHETENFSQDNDKTESRIVWSNYDRDDEPVILSFIPAHATGLRNWEFHKGDADPFPSIPHAHQCSDDKRKLDPFLGFIYLRSAPDGRESRESIVRLWNDKKFRLFAQEVIEHFFQQNPHWRWRVTFPFRLPRVRG